MTAMQEDEEEGEDEERQQSATNDSARTYSLTFLLHASAHLLKTQLDIWRRKPEHKENWKI